MKRLILALAFVLLRVVSSEAAFAVVQHKTCNDSSVVATLSCTVTSTGASHQLVVLPLLFNAAARTITSVDDGTTNFTQCASGTLTATGSFAGTVIDCYYLPSSASGKTSITVHLSGTATFVEMGVVELSGVTSANFAQDGNPVNNSTAGSTCVTTTCTGAALTTTSTIGFGYTIMGFGDHTTGAGGANQFTDFVDVPGDGWAGKISAAAATYTPVFVDPTSGDVFISYAVAFKDSSAGGGVTCAPTLTLLGVGRCGD